MAKMNGSDEVAGRTIEIDQKSLYGVLRGFVEGISGDGGGGGEPLPRRIRASFLRTVPNLREASRNSAHDLLRWTRQGSPLRALLVIAVGTITLISLTGLLVFMLFFVAATLNAIIISALMSLAAAGGFLAFFFACSTAIYIGALLTAVFVISAITISTIIAVTIATGWIGFFCIVWMAAKKSMDLTKQSLSLTSSAISVYTASRRTQQDASLKSPPVETDTQQDASLKSPPVETN